MRRLHLTAAWALCLAVTLAAPTAARAQDQLDQWGMKPTTRRGPDEGAGPFDRLIIRGVTVIDGTGAPPRGPMDIVIEGNEIVAVRSVGSAGVPINPRRRPQGATHEIDAEGMYVTPGFIDVHAHTGREKIDYQASYVYKLWLGHGITAAKGVSFGDLEWSLRQHELSEANEIVAPRLVVCANVGAGDEWEGREVRTPEQANEWVHYAKEKGVQCLGELGSLDPPIMASVLATADSLSIQTMAHLNQMGVARMNAADAAKLGLDEVTHFYGLLESLLDEHTVQTWPLDYNYNNEYDRFSRVARLWNQIAEPGSKKWNDLIELFLSKDVILSPTMTIYLAGRNVMSARNADWHDEYTLPSMAEYFRPNPEAHGSYFYNWTSADEAAWQNFYNVWMKFIDDYNDAGGRITAGSDAGFIYQLFGFGYIQELKLLQEAGLTPFEILRAATLYAAESIFEPREPNGEPIQYGVIRPGLKADLLVFDRNPLTDFNLLYGTGAMRLNRETGQVERVRALKYTIKDGIIYDSQKLLADVRQMVADAKRNAHVATDAPQPE